MLQNVFRLMETPIVDMLMIIQIAISKNGLQTVEEFTSPEASKFAKFLLNLGAAFLFTLRYEAETRPTKTLFLHYFRQ